MTDDVIEALSAAAFTVPTDLPESDGTLEWDSTTIVVVEAAGGGHTGTGYTYQDRSAADFVQRVLAGVVVGRDATMPAASWSAMTRAVRNVGRRGFASYAISAVDIALWDLAARLLDVPLHGLLGAVRSTVPVYGSGGFTSYDHRQLCAQLAGWVEQGIPRVKMKVGRDAAADADRVAAARRAVGRDVELYVDANGGYARKQAIQSSAVFADHGVTWHEEPVSSDDVAGLRLIRDRAPAGMDITAGEYATVPAEFRELLTAGSVDCLQVDVTRAGGFTGFARAAALADAFQVDVSAHTAPHASMFACAAAWHLRHAEWFHDHVRVEGLLFDGALNPEDGLVQIPTDSAGLGLQLKTSDAEGYRAWP